LVKAGVNPAAFNYDSMADDVVDLMPFLRTSKADFATDDQWSHVAFGVLEATGVGAHPYSR
jgi:hypothetical protein